MARVDSDGLDRYGSLLTLLRVCAEISAAVLVTLAFGHWLGGGWQVFLPAAGLLLLARYALIGVGPRAMGRQRAERVARTASRLLSPLRPLGPLQGARRGGRRAPVRRPRRRPRAQRPPRRGRPGRLHRVPGRNRAGRTGDGPLGLRARRHDRPRGHGPAHRHGLHRARQDRGPGALPRAPQRVLPHPGDRREHRRRGRDRLPQGHGRLGPRAPGRGAHRAGRHDHAPRHLRPRVQAGRRAAPPDAGDADPRGDRHRRVRRHGRPGDDRGHPRGDRRGDRRRVRQRARPGRVARPRAPPG